METIIVTGLVIVHAEMLPYDTCKYTVSEALVRAYGFASTKVCAHYATVCV